MSNRPILGVVKPGKGVADQPPAPPSDAERATRERVILALIPVAARVELQKPQHMVETATKLCYYINTGEQQDKP